ncbi:hypothetical protein LCGC14_2283040 [marine sediment metagenome]|uniref:SF4 helicase domain-containing protein n=1 Tax=marine sediment metagenome TaxID=412755 RepID=A0A0F9F5Z9_9ZZZZ
MTTNPKLTPEELENRLLSSIQCLDDVIHCERAGISEESFRATDPVEHGEVWDYISCHARDHSGKLPTDKDLSSLFEFTSSGAGDLKTYVTRVREQELKFKARGVLMRHIAGLAEDSSADAAETLRKTSSELGELQSSSGRRVVYFDRDAMSRLDRFDEARRRIEKDGIIGIPTGLKPFDAEQRGLFPGEVVIVAASTGVGKSWMLCYMTVNAYEAGRRILIISPELTADEQSARLDSVLAGRRNKKLSNFDITTGRANRNEYKAWLEGLEDDDRLAILDSSDTGGPFTFPDIWQYALEFKPDVLVVDGLHLIAGVDETQKGWEVLKSGIAHLKALAQKEDMVVICAHQVQRSAASRKAETIPPALAQIGYGFAVVETADHVVTMSRSAGGDMERLYRVVKARGIKEVVEKLTLHWNVDVGDIHDKGGAERLDKPFDKLEEDV